MDDIAEVVRSYLLAQFLPGEDPAALTEATPLVTSAILDSLATLQLVAFLEERFGIRLEPHEASADHLNTVADIARLVRAKLGG